MTKFRNLRPETIAALPGALTLPADGTPLRPLVISSREPTRSGRSAQSGFAAHQRSDGARRLQSFANRRRSK